jgi:protein-disulfide isomerase
MQRQSGRQEHRDQLHPNRRYQRSYGFHNTILFLMKKCGIVKVANTYKYIKAEEFMLKGIKIQSNRWTQIIFVALLVVAAFLVGSLYTKVQYLEKNSGSPSAAGAVKNTAKYASYDDAIKAIGKTVKLDTNKLVACMNSGEKKAIVDADASQGTGVGVEGTPAFFINGKFLGGAFPTQVFKEIIDKELGGKSSTVAADYSDYLQKAAQQGAFNPVPKTIDIGAAPVEGAANAKVTIIVFSDFQCPYCKQGYTTIKEVLKAYPDSVRLVFKHFPLSFHPRAHISAEAAECAKDQGKFWEFHNAMFEAQSDWSTL